MQVPSLGREDPLEEGMAPHSSILACEIPWTEGPGRLRSTVSQRVGHYWNDLACVHTNVIYNLPDVSSTRPYLEIWISPVILLIKTTHIAYLNRCELDYFLTWRIHFSHKILKLRTLCHGQFCSMREGLGFSLFAQETSMFVHIIKYCKYIKLKVYKKYVQIKYSYIYMHIYKCMCVYYTKDVCTLYVEWSHSVVSDSLRPHGL